MPAAGDTHLYDAATLRFYADEAPAYTSSRPDGASKHLAAFLDRLQPGSQILELGCGGGRDTRAMIQRGFIVDATDGSGEMARAAEARTGQAVRVMRFDQLDAVEAYDAVWAHASLLHAPRTALPGILKLVFRALRPGGLHFANFKGGGTEGRDRLGRYYNFFDAAELGNLYRAAGPWEIVATEDYVSSGYDSVQRPWVALTVRKPA